MRSTTPLEVIEVPWKYKSPTGLSDILPDSLRYWQYSEDLLNRVAGSFGFTRVITPPVESKSLYESVFSSSVLDNLIDSSIDEGGEHYVFRAHPRVSLIRSFKQNHFSELPPPLHFAYQASTMQKTPLGYNQRYYYCFDVLGAKDVTTSATMLMLLRKLASELHVKNTSIIMHSSGCEACRPGYNSVFAEYAKPHLNTLCPVCIKSATVDQIIHCEIDSHQSWLEGAPAFLDHLCVTCRSQLEGILEVCDQLGLTYDVDPRFFVDQPEAEQTTFTLRIGEETTPAIVGFYYDRFATALADHPLSALGITIDMEQLSRYLDQQHVTLPSTAGIQVFVAQLGQQAKSKCIPLLQQLYEAGYCASTAAESESIAHQLQVAERLHAKITLIVGQKEAMNGHVIMRDMLSGIQDNVYMDELISTLSERFTAIV